MIRCSISINKNGGCMNKIHVFAKSFIYSLNLAWKANKLLLIIFIVTQFANATIPLLNAYVLSSILNNLVYSSYKEDLITDIVLFAFLTILIRVTGIFLNFISSLLDQKVSRVYEITISNKLNDMPLSFLDSAEGKDLIDEVTYVKTTATTYYKEVISIASVLYTFIIAFAELIKFNVLFSLLFIALTVPGIIVEHIFDKKNEELRRDMAPDVRKFSYYKWMLLDKWPAKDVRMYNLSDCLRKRYNEEKDSYLKANKKLDKSKLIYSIIAEIIKRSGEIVFTVFVVSEAIKGHITVGAVALYTSFAVTISSSFQNSAEILIEMFTVSVDKMLNFFNFLSYSSYKNNTAFRHVDKFKSLEFKNVYFKYPLQKTNVLNGVTFTLNQGDRLSIVGINGAGKTTIIKLMLGLYEIDSGEILLNGFPLSEYFIDDVHSLFSVLFQQFAQYPLTLRENVALSAVQCMNDTDRIIKAMKQSTIYDQYKDNIEDSMTRKFDDNGIELSRGQWQKVALARTYFKNTPILVFDEPSAALDAEAEDYILKNYSQLSENKTGVMISHRIYGNKYSTKIIVLDKGKIVENGSHNELIKLNGFYAKLFKMQKEKYAYRSEDNS